MSKFVVLKQNCLIDPAEVVIMRVRSQSLYPCSLIASCSIQDLRSLPYRSSLGRQSRASFELFSFATLSLEVSLSCTLSPLGQLLLSPLVTRKQTWVNIKCAGGQLIHKSTNHSSQIVALQEKFYWHHHHVQIDEVTLSYVREPNHRERQSGAGEGACAQTPSRAAVQSRNQPCMLSHKHQILFKKTLT